MYHADELTDVSHKPTMAILKHLWLTHEVVNGEPREDSFITPIHDAHWVLCSAESRCFQDIFHLKREMNKITLINKKITKYVSLHTCYRPWKNLVLVNLVIQLRHGKKIFKSDFLIKHRDLCNISSSTSPRAKNPQMNLKQCFPWWNMCCFSTYQ